MNQISLFDFEFNNSQLSLKNALLLAQASGLAYDLPDIIEKDARSKWSMKDFSFIQKDDSECFIGANTDVILLVFRGTEQNSLKDWITDFQFRKKLGPWKLGVHRGFKEAVDLVWDEVYQRIVRLTKIANRPLFIAGHSLGGALATLATANFLEENFPVKALYTFGQPRVGGKLFVNKFNKSFKYTYRFVNNEDIVTRVPFKPFNYDHIGCLRYFDSDRNLRIEPDEKFISQDRYKGVEVRSTEEFHHLRHLYPNEFEDHGLGQYIYNIEKAIREESWKTRPDGNFLKYINQ